MSSRSGACRTSEHSFLPSGTRSMLVSATETQMRFHTSLLASLLASASSSTHKVQAENHMPLVHVCSNTLVSDTALKCMDKTALMDTRLMM